MAVRKLLATLMLPIEMIHQETKLKRILRYLIFAGVVLSSQALGDTQDAVVLSAPGCDPGVGVVINLREPSELDWNEAEAASSLGLTYYNVPIAAAGNSFDAAAMKKITALVGKHKDTKILLHCSSGNRASAWLAIHLAQDHAVDVETSISLARKAGLAKPVIETRVRNYLNEAEQSPQRSD